MVEVRIVNLEYKTGLRCAKDDIDQKRILVHNQLKELNYTILP